MAFNQGAIQASRYETSNASTGSSSSYLLSSSSSGIKFIPFGPPDPSLNSPKSTISDSIYATFGVLGTNARFPGADSSFSRTFDPSKFPWVYQIPTPCDLAFLTPEITAILKYKCSKYSPAVIFEPPSPGTSRPSRKEGRADELIFQRCNTCETAYGQYTLCDHESDDGDYDKTVYTERIKDRLEPVSIDNDNEDKLPKSIGEIEYEMLHPGNLSKLLTINTDKHVTQYVAFTAHGTLLGYSDSITIKKARKIASLTGLTWRSKSLVLTDGDPLPTGVLPAQSTVLDKAGNLSSMIVEMDNAIAAVCRVKETIIIAAVLILEVPKSQAERSTQPIKEPTTAKQEPEPPTPNPDPENPTTSSPPNQDRPSPDPKDKESEPPAPPPPPPKPQPTSQQLKILSWRTEAMANVLREDLADFKMPDGVF